MATKRGSKGKGSAKPRRKLAVSKETLKDLTVKGTGVKGGMLPRTENRYCFSSNPTCPAFCKTQLDCI